MYLAFSVVTKVFVSPVPEPPPLPPDDGGRVAFHVASKPSLLNYLYVSLLGVAFSTFEYHIKDTEPARSNGATVLYRRM